MTWLVLIMLGVHLLNTLLGGLIQTFGIVPGQIHTLPYVITAPFIHGSWAHLASNLIGFSIFSALCLLRGMRFYLRSSVFIIVLTGLLVWLLGRPATHIGASGWIFGLWSLSIAMAWFERRFVNIVIAIFVVVFYGGMIWGVLPGSPGVSFESHLFGAISGIVCAYVMSRKTVKSTGAKRIQ